MKKLFLLVALTFGMMINAQNTQVTTKKLQLESVPVGTKNDSLLVRGSDKIVKTIPLSTAIQGLATTEETNAALNEIKNNISSSFILSNNGYNVSGLNVTVNANWEWQLKGVYYTNSEPFIYTTPLSSAGKQRFDIVVLTDIGMQLHMGTESVSNPAIPVYPFDNLMAITFLVTDSNVTTTPTPNYELTSNKQNSLAVDGTGIKYTTVDAVRTHTTDINNPHNVTKSQVGLANVDNTSDSNKPISTATQTALDGKQAALGFTPENVANKQNSLAVDGTGTKYPTVDAVKTYADGLDSGNIHTSGNDTKSGNLYFSNGGVASGVITTITPTVSGQACRIAYLSDTNITEPKTLVLYFHGSSETQDTPFTGLGKNITDKLISEGYIVAASFASGNAWGNQDSQDDYYDLYAYINGLYNINKVVFIGQSMGGLTSLNLLASNRITKCYAWYGVYPVTNLNEAYFNEGFASAIETAYGFVGSGNYAAATAGFDPQLATTSLFAEKTYDMTASPDDTLIFKTTNSDLFKTKINSVAFRANVFAATGAHGDASHFLPNNVISSFDYFATNSVGTSGYIGKFGNYKDIFNSDIFQNRVNIGIGTVSPARKVHIKDNVGFYEVLRLESISSEAVIEMKDSAGVLTTFGTVLGDFYIGTPLIKHLTINRSTGNATFTGTVTSPTAAPGTTGNQIATLDYVLANRGATSGTYTPTLYDFANTSARKLVKATYSKIGDIVTVFIHLTVDVITANTDTVVTVSLPINKVNTSLYELGAGVGRLSSVNTNEFTVRTSNVTNTNDIIRLVFKPVSSGTNIVSASFSYAIN